MPGTAKKVTVTFDGEIVGTRRNTREYTHAVVNTAAKSVISYHLTEAAAIDNANRYRMRGASYVAVLPTVIDLKPRYECLDKDLVPENFVIVTKDTYVAAKYFFGKIASKKYGSDAKVRDVECFGWREKTHTNGWVHGLNYRAFIGVQGEGEGVVQGQSCEITVRDIQYRQPDAVA